MQEVAIEKAAPADNLPAGIQVVQLSFDSAMSNTTWPVVLDAN